MKKIILTGLLLQIAFNCNAAPNTPQGLVAYFIKARKAGDIPKMHACLSRSVYGKTVSAFMKHSDYDFINNALTAPLKFACIEKGKKKGVTRVIWSFKSLVMKTNFTIYYDVKKNAEGKYKIINIGNLQAEKDLKRSREELRKTIKKMNMKLKKIGKKYIKTKDGKWKIIDDPDR